MTIPPGIRHFVRALIMLIVGETHRVGAEVGEIAKSSSWSASRDGPALDRSVLVHGHALQVLVLPVEKEALVGVEFARSANQVAGSRGPVPLPCGDRKVTTVRYRYGSLTPCHSRGFAMFEARLQNRTPPRAQRARHHRGRSHALAVCSSDGRFNTAASAAERSLLAMREVI